MKRLLFAFLAVIATGSQAQAQTGGLSGTVTEAATGTPIGAADVAVYHSAGFFQGSASTTGSGTYMIADLAPGTCCSRARHLEA